MLVNKGFLLIVLNYYIRGSQGKLALTWLQLRPRLPIDPVVVVFNSGLSKNEPGQLGPASEVEVDQLVGLAGHCQSSSALGRRSNEQSSASVGNKSTLLFRPSMSKTAPSPPFGVHGELHAHACTCTHMHAHALTHSFFITPSSMLLH